MAFSFNLFSVLLLFFFLHGLIFAILSLYQYISNRAEDSLWLGTLLILYCLYVTPFMLGYAGWYGLNHYREILFYLPLQHLFLIGPVFYMYIRSLLYPDLTVRKKDGWHFVPGLIYILYSLFMFLGDVFGGTDFYGDGRDRDLDLWYQVTGYFSVIVYFGAGYLLYQEYRKRIFNRLSFAEEVSYSWVRQILILFLLIVVFRMLFFIINPEWGEFGRKFWYYLAVSLVIYYLSLQGIRHSELMKLVSLRNQVVPRLPWILPEKQVADEEPENQREMSERHRQLAERLNHLFIHKKVYENPFLTLDGLAAELDTTSKNISTAINLGTGMNFNDYVNKFRIEAVIGEFNKGRHKQKSFLGIALSCGFNSKSTFNRAFRKHTGLSPRDYLEKEE